MYHQLISLRLAQRRHAHMLWNAVLQHCLGCVSQHVMKKLASPKRLCDLQTPPEGTDANIQNSYLVDESISGSGNDSLTELGQAYASYPC